MQYLSLAVLFTLAACSSFSGSKNAGTVMQIGKDSYTVRALSERSTSAAKQGALSLANAACQKQTRSVMITQEHAGIEEGTGERFYDLNFMCLTHGDTDFQRVRRDATQTAPATAPATAE